MSIFKYFKTRTGRIVLRTAPFVVGAAVIGVGSYSYAKYVSTHEDRGEANVASIGIEIFELMERGKTTETIDYAGVVPGLDIPAPRIRLRIDSEVSYSLYVTVTAQLPTYTYTVGEGTETKQTVEFFPGTNWSVVSGDENYSEGNAWYNVTYIYKYEPMFVAGTRYDYTDGNELPIFRGNSTDNGGVLFVSQDYGAKGANRMPFSITYEAYLRQVLE